MKKGKIIAGLRELYEPVRTAGLSWWMFVPVFFVALILSLIQYINIVLPNKRGFKLWLKVMCEVGLIVALVFGLLGLVGLCCVIVSYLVKFVAEFLPSWAIVALSVALAIWVGHGLVKMALGDDSDNLSEETNER